MRTSIEKSIVLKILETEINFFGIPYSELKFVLIEVGATLTIPTLADLVGISFGGYFYLFMAVLMVATIIALRRMGKHKYKNYAVSVVQFRLQQPKLIRATKSE